MWPAHLIIVHLTAIIHRPCRCLVSRNASGLHLQSYLEGRLLMHTLRTKASIRREGLSNVISALHLQLSEHTTFATVSPKIPWHITIVRLKEKRPMSSSHLVTCPHSFIAVNHPDLAPFSAATISDPPPLQEGWGQVAAVDTFKLFKWWDDFSQLERKQTHCHDLFGTALWKSGLYDLFIE